MKIAVCGAIIDTSDIYMIHEVKQSMELTRLETFSFIIESFNNKKLRVVQPIGKWEFNGGRYSQFGDEDLSPKEIAKWKERSIEYSEFIKLPEYIKAKEEIERLKAEVLAHWTGFNNTRIPQVGNQETYIQR